MSNEHVLGFRPTFSATFLGLFLMIYALLSQNFNVGSYALFLQIFCDFSESANFFAFRIYEHTLHNVYIKKWGFYFA